MNTISERLRRVMDIDPEAPAVQFGGSWFRWGDLRGAAREVEALLARCGLGPGASVGIMLRNRPAQLGALFGVLRAGACAVTVNPLLGRERLRDDLEKLDLPLLLGTAEDLALVPEALVPTTGRGALGALGTPIALTPGREPAAGSVDPAVAVRMLTSGTTGPPKRVDLTYDTLEQVMRGAKH